MSTRSRWQLPVLFAAVVATTFAAPRVSRLTPPSGLFSYGDPEPPIIARFLPGQRFDLQATISPDAGQTVVGVKFYVDDAEVPGQVTLVRATVSGLPANSVVARLRAYSQTTPGVHRLLVSATQLPNSQSVIARGNFEIVALPADTGLPKVKNLIFMIGDGLGIAHRTATRIVLHGVSQGKALAPLAMDTFPVTGLVQTASLSAIVTDSSPGASCYSTGNKNDNNEEGVFPDDTTDAFDNPRMEYLGEYLARTQGKSLGLVTTTDVFDATPAAWAVHTQNRSAGTGICDQYLDEAVPKSRLTVLLGGGRKWFLPATTPGSGRTVATDYTLPAELATAWNVVPGAIDPNRDLLTEFQQAGFTYVATATQLKALPAATDRLLGLFALSHLNVASDKIDGRRGRRSIVEDHGFPDQPMLDEMVDAALPVLAKNPNGFVLMVEGGSIDKQSHNMDSERWVLEVIEFDRAVARARAFAAANPDTLVIVTADHETGGTNVIGASRVTQANLNARASSGAANVAQLRDPVVGTYENAGFPVYGIMPDGYPATTNPDRKMLIGYAANADRYEDWQSHPLPLRDSNQPFATVPPLVNYPANAQARKVGAGYFIAGQVPGATAVHTGSDIPLSAYGRGAALFTGTMDNTDVFFRAMRAILVGADNTIAER
ncbi:MAG: alkaline phosphatase [Verrucomicrobia bacterium]|nr:alkaline phosphatase [Verrucomicrobiota bacterium]